MASTDVGPWVDIIFPFLFTLVALCYWKYSKVTLDFLFSRRTELRDFEYLSIVFAFFITIIWNLFQDARPALFIALIAAVILRALLTLFSVGKFLDAPRNVEENLKKTSKDFIYDLKTVLDTGFLETTGTFDEESPFKAVRVKLQAALYATRIFISLIGRLPDEKRDKIGEGLRLRIERIGFWVELYRRINILRHTGSSFECLYRVKNPGGINLTRRFKELITKTEPDLFALDDDAVYLEFFGLRQNLADIIELLKEFENILVKSGVSR
jgi:hypothetical protein